MTATRPGLASDVFWGVRRMPPSARHQVSSALEYERDSGASGARSKR